MAVLLRLRHLTCGNSAIAAKVSSTVLTHAQNPDEAKAWLSFYAFIGNTLMTISPDSLFAQARTWYENTIKSEISVNSDLDARALATRAEYGNGNRTPSSSHDQSRGFRPRGNNDNNDNPNLPPRDDSKWCDYHRRTGHHTKDCRNRQKDQAYLEWDRQHRNNNDNRNSDNQPRAVAVRVYRTSNNSNSSMVVWLYDSCSTHHMTDKFRYLYNFELFDKPLDVFGIGKQDELHSLVAIGSGTVVLSSSESGNTHAIHDVLYVPGLNESIISKSCTQFDGLRTSMNDNENFILTASSGFSITSSTINGMESFHSVSAMETSASAYTAKAADTNEDDTQTTISPTSSPASDINELTSEVSDTPPAASKSSSDVLWHNRFAHTSSKRISKVLNRKIQDITCESCILGKMTSTPFAKVTDKSNIPLHRVYIDHCGPIIPTSNGGNKYVLNIRDECTGYTWSYPVPNKSAKVVISLLKSWLPNVQRQSGRELKIVRTDDAQEFKSVFQQYLQPLGIEHEATAGYASASNGAVERIHRALFDIVRPLIKTASMPATFWADAVKHGCYIMNRLPSSANANGESPYFLFYGKQPKLNHLRTFGCIAYHRLPIEQIKASHKVDDRAVKCVMLGHLGSRMYRLYNLDTQRVIKSRSVKFHEMEFASKKDYKIPDPSSYSLQVEFMDFTDEEFDAIYLDDTPSLLPIDGFTTVTRPAPASQSPTSSSNTISNVNRFAVLSDEDSDDDDDNDDDIISQQPSSHHDDTDPPPNNQLSNPQEFQPSSQNISHPSNIASGQTPTPTSITTASSIPRTPTAPATRPPPRSTPAQRVSGRERQPSENAKLAAESERIQQESRRSRNPKSNAVSAIEPKSYYESQLLPEAEKWDAAALEEIYSLDDLGTWEMVLRPTDRKVLKSRFVLKIKDKHTKTPIFKARLVARGFAEVKGLDYTSTYAPVVKPSSFRTILAISAAQKRVIHQFDVKNAYGNAWASGESYMEQPEGFEDPEFPSDKYVLKILKALYGRHSSALEWNETLCDKLTDIGFVRSETDPCIFVSKERSLILAVYVDDFLVSALDSEQIAWLLAKLNENFETRDLGPAKRFLGIDIHRPDPTGPIFINQGIYIRQILSEFGMSKCNAVPTPLSSSIKLEKRKPDEKSGDIEWYRCIIGKFMHLLYTRIDIACAVSKLAQYLSDPSETHCQSAKHLLRYLKGTMDLGIQYGTDNSNGITGYCDASFDDDPDTSRSTSGQVFMYNGGSISHSSKKQSMVTLSTMEAESVALSDAAREAKFLRYLLEDLDLDNLPNESIPMRSKKYQVIELLTDSQPAYDHATNSLNNNRTKHIHRRFNFAREAHNNGDINLQRIPATEQAADVLTKILPKIKHAEALQLLNMRSITIPL